jgi:hypothetical protein
MHGGREGEGYLSLACLSSDAAGTSAEEEDVTEEEKDEANWWDMGMQTSYARSSRQYEDG